MIDVERTSDIELLRTIAKIQDAELKRTFAKLEATTRELAKRKGLSEAELQEQLKKLEQQVAETTARVYGGGSERRPRAESKPTKPKKAQKGHGPNPQKDLPLEPVIHTLDEADQLCPTCGGQLETWSGQFEDSDEVDLVDIKYVRRRHRRQKYKCSAGCGCIETALGPTRLISGGRYSSDFAIHVALSKYEAHLPLERQVRLMKRYGLEITSQTLWDQTWALYDRLKPLAKRLHDFLLTQDVLMVDETRWPLLGVRGRKTKNWFIWAVVGDKAIQHHILDSRSAEAGRRVLEGFKGVVLSDGYVVYESLQKSEGYTLANDWSHARRKFIEAEASDPELATAFLDDIGALFGIERRLKEQTAELAPKEALALRREVRQADTKPIVQRLGERAAGVRAFRESPIAKAIQYLENRWDGLKVFLDDPRVPITSNPVEASLRNPVLGRNNHFGSRSKRGTEVSALMYSLIESAKINGVDPQAYFRKVLGAALQERQLFLPHEMV